MVEGVQSQDPTVQLEAVTKFRKLLSIGERRRPLGSTHDENVLTDPFHVLQSATRRSAR